MRQHGPRRRVDRPGRTNGSSRSSARAPCSPPGPGVRDSSSTNRAVAAWVRRAWLHVRTTARPARTSAAVWACRGPRSPGNLNGMLRKKAAGREAGVANTGDEHGRAGAA